MDNTQDLCNIEGDDEDEGEGRNDDSCCISSTSYRLFGRQMSIHQMMGGGKAADVILWKRQHVSCGIVVVATIAWILFEQSGLSFLLICSDVLLILVVLLFLRANYAVFRKKHLRTLPELVLSEEMVINAAASFRVKINYVLLLAHDITLGRDFRLFFKVVICLWLLSVIGSVISSFTLVYIGMHIHSHLSPTVEHFVFNFCLLSSCFNSSHLFHYKQAHVAYMALSSTTMMRR
ncbi:reticulon-like protein B16 isoform X2 [Camellia sinensis]|uniref:reticulon-like protein B16 isoform X1 n=1 Tax=Camellia sinensis TaxID=4442 RepID=UPI0010368983|nr:reticulon-like protein B16 isoform X1 [Camellia sinensis]XP_028124389.1 reticulon-like protein B16 isoform X2 [Camellia sinensis]